MKTGTILLSILFVVPLMAGAQKVWDYDDFTVTKISNPDRGEREVDGLVPGGDRENSYTWRMAAHGDEIYIATARNIASALVNMYGSQISAASGMSMDTFWAMIDAFANGDIMRNDVNEGASIIAYNRKTGEFRVVWTGGPGEYQRMAVTFGDNVYFGSYSADQSIEQYILKLDKEGNFTKVYTTTGTTAMRANCIYDDHLFFASADARTVVAEGDPEPLAKMAVIRKSNEDDTQWDPVADYRDFGNIPYDHIHTSWAGAPFWELASHKGYIYATAPSTAGFVIFKGRPAQDGEKANQYGWHWEEVVGPNNGINNPGLSDVTGGEPGTMRSLIGSVYEFNGELYAYNFDHAFAGVAQGFVGMLQKLKSGDVKASDYLSYMYNTLHNQQKIWKLNDDTGKFEELTAFTKLMEGTLNEYVWRMGEHNGKLYVATMDAGIGYGYLTQLTNGSFFKMSPEEKASKLCYLSNAIKLLLEPKIKEKASELRTKLELLMLLMSQFVATEQVDDETIEVVIDIKGLTELLRPLIKAYLDAKVDQAAEALKQLPDFIADLKNRIDVKGLEMYAYINNAVKNNEWGFDLLRTSDGGQSFEVITRTGFDDKYNYGCSSFLSTEEGLYFGTCNPFYGGQLYLLSEKNSKKANVVDIAAANPSLVTLQPSLSEWYSLDGRKLDGRSTSGRLLPQGRKKPTLRGVYINNGKKRVVK